MTEKEKLEHELILNAIKVGIMNSRSLSDVQKYNALNKLDEDAHKADWLMEVLRACGYL